jgi:hypothetical protein
VVLAAEAEVEKAEVEAVEVVEVERVEAGVVIETADPGMVIIPYLSSDHCRMQGMKYRLKTMPQSSL